METFDFADPATEEPTFSVDPLPGDAARDLVARARDARPSAPAATRAGWLRAGARRLLADADQLSALIVSDVGKPIGEARAEVTRAARILDYVASLADRATGQVFEDATGGHMRVLRRPRGVALLITPWNFPLAIPVWKLAPALQAGNAVVLKPAPQATRLATELVSALHASGVPEAVLQLAPGGAETASALIDSGPDVVSFTGSTRVGQAVAVRGAQAGAEVQCEMGGKNSVYVGEGADLAQATTIVLAGAMGYAGQKCTATSVVYAHAAVADALQEELVRGIAGLGVGDPREDGNPVGPLILAGARDRVVQAIGDVTAASGPGGGAELVAGGDVPARPGWFVSPTLVRGGDPDGRAYREEFFGPVLALRPVEGVEEAVAETWRTQYGLVAGIVSDRRSEVEHFVRHAKAGVIRVNAPTTGLEPHVPFGGVGASSHGPREQGEAGLEFFSETVTVYG